MCRSTGGRLADGPEHFLRTGAKRGRPGRLVLVFICVLGFSAPGSDAGAAAVWPVQKPVLLAPKEGYIFPTSKGSCPGGTAPSRVDEISPARFQFLNCARQKSEPKQRNQDSPPDAEDSANHCLRQAL